MKFIQRKGENSRERNLIFRTRKQRSSALSYITGRFGKHKPDRILKNNYCRVHFEKEYLSKRFYVRRSKGERDEYLEESSKASQVTRNGSNPQESDGEWGRGRMF